MASSYAAFTVPEARFSGATMKDTGSGEVLFVRQGPVVVVIAPEGFDLYADLGAP